jgi:hypothetical protein
MNSFSAALPKCSSSASIRKYLNCLKSTSDYFK